MVPSRLAGLISDLHHRCRASHMAKVGDSPNQADSCRPEAQSTQQPGFINHVLPECSRALPLAYCLWPPSCSGDRVEYGDHMANEAENIWDLALSENVCAPLL